MSPGEQSVKHRQISDHRTAAALLSAVGRAVLDSLIPRDCPLCSATDITSNEIFCQECVQSLQVLSAIKYCRRCGVSTGKYSAGRSCSYCKAYPAATQEIVRFGPFDHSLADCIRRLKYGGAAHIAPATGKLLASALRESSWIQEVDVFTWVPTSFMHRVTRPFHAATEIAPWIAREFPIPLCKLLERKNGGTHQVGLKRSQRIENVKGKFRVVRGARLDGATVCVLDDVATTNATLFECARTLKRVGVNRVYGAVVAHAGGVTMLPKDV